MARKAIPVTDELRTHIQRLAAQGLTQALIAQQLGVSGRTFERWLADPSVRQSYQDGKQGIAANPPVSVDSPPPTPTPNPPPQSAIKPDIIPPQSATIPTKPATSIASLKQRLQDNQPNDLAQIEILAGFGLTLDQIAITIGISPSTLDKWLKDPDINTLYKRGKAKAEAEISKTLFQKARDGNIPALIWYEKTRFGRTEKRLDEMEALKVLVEAGWIPDSVVELAGTKIDETRDALRDAFQQRLMPSAEAS
ncbi:hypothetical protein H6G00_01645 [Leptolyngbya sp. FACHB-541]|uniref:helix-turn-helix domain-containing protein n=1 Tax=Leptolyngbya sp. FACHB-541 TaxID=2692810 RepID=UPI00168490B6|nr:helix-turn-helix domain-containing protein [Leptolyngbya sp. FACHB-541]MBD1995334.1 hypothetical protein [Leptolyngbya sp. FACHB-541]